MNIVLVTGSCGLVGSEAVKYYSQKGYAVIGIENDIRKKLFGEEGSTYSTKIFLKNNIKNYIHYQMDIRNEKGVNKIFREYNRDIKLIIHTAAQPSHDWAASNPIEDFTINALGTINLLENMRNHSSEAVFIFTSTNKVYGNTPNFLPLIEEETRWELESSHNWFDGIDETMTVDQSLHSLFGVSKLSADLMVQEYGRYFNLKTGIFRCGCIT